MILIGGQALKNLGSSRNTEDYDYLIYDSSSDSEFICTDKVDHLNAAKNKFFNEIYEIESGNEQASPQSLTELKAYALVQHYQNCDFQKADDCEYDIKFLARKFNINSLTIAKKYMTTGQYNEIQSILNSVKNEK